MHNTTGNRLWGSIKGGGEPLIQHTPIWRRRRREGDSTLLSYFVEYIRECVEEKSKRRAGVVDLPLLVPRRIRTSFE
jgi:hypothetical protein